MSIVNELKVGLRRGDTRALSRAITLVESRLPADRQAAEQIIETCSSFSNKTHRIAVTGVPGVGKSTFIEAIGLRLVDAGKKVAVLAIDPSSSRTSGSILGDKTRMDKLSSHPLAFIRPSASALTLGGVARNTRETILLCEAAGYHTVIIETVGVGQSETTVRGMVDSFVLLMLAGAGDELQGIKRGIMEMADILLINKVEEDNLSKARNAHSDYKTAMHMLGQTEQGWSATVGMVSALTGYQIDEAIKMIEAHFAFLLSSAMYEKQRLSQDLLWFDEAVRQSIIDNYLENVVNRTRLEEQRQMVEQGETSPLEAVRKALNG
jgi:LAO/AO transport system kinase